MKINGNIALVDDDPGQLRAIERLLRAHGNTLQTHASAASFLDALEESPPDCAIFDIEMPGLSGIDLHAQLRDRGLRLPVVFLTGEGSIALSVQAIRAGALNFLTKPVEEEVLVEAIEQALELAAELRRVAAELSDLRERLGRLTPRELEVLRHVIAGKLNKQIAADLGVSEQTVKVHRMHLTEKTGLTSVAELVRASDRLNIAAAD